MISLIIHCPPLLHLQTYKRFYGHVSTHWGSVLDTLVLNCFCVHLKQGSRFVALKDKKYLYYIKDMEWNACVNNAK